LVLKIDDFRERKIPVSIRTFEVIVRGRLSPWLLAAFDDLWSTRCDRGITHFVGCVRDQETLHRLFHLLRDLNIEVLSVNSVKEESPEGS
jgi:hypothetical protein